MFSRSSQNVSISNISDFLERQQQLLTPYQTSAQADAKYQTISGMNAYALSLSLSNYALNSSLSLYQPIANMSNFVTQSQLASSVNAGYSATASDARYIQVSNPIFQTAVNFNNQTLNNIGTLNAVNANFTGTLSLGTPNISTIRFNGNNILDFTSGNPTFQTSVNFNNQTLNNIGTLNATNANFTGTLSLGTPKIATLRFNNVPMIVFTSGNSTFQTAVNFNNQTLNNIGTLNATNANFTGSLSLGNPTINTIRFNGNNMLDFTSGNPTFQTTVNFNNQNITNVNALGCQQLNPSSAMQNALSVASIQNVANFGRTLRNNNGVLAWV